MNHLLHPFVVVILFIRIAFLGLALVTGFILTFFIFLIFQNITLIQRDPKPDEFERMYRLISNDERKD